MRLLDHKNFAALGLRYATLFVSAVTLRKLGLLIRSEQFRATRPISKDVFASRSLELYSHE